MIQESETLELKREYTDTVRKDIIAFANTAGGTILLGVSDDGSVLGVKSPDRLIQRISNMVRDSIKPDITMFLHYETEQQDGRTIVRITVSRGTARPYYWKEKGLCPAGVIVRQGTSSAPASESAIRQMIKETDGDSFEEMRSLSQELDFTYVSEAFRRQNLAFDTPQMKILGILSSDEIYTNLGLLLSDQCPYTIRVAVFSRSDQNSFQNRREFSGSLLKQADEVYALLDTLNENRSDFSGLHRIDHRAYPETALREALLNAIVHRDYSVSASTLISCYPDRIEITSVGGLMPGFSLDDVMMGISVCRNPKLAEVFYRLHLIEAYGTGLSKILHAYSFVPADSLIQTTGRVFKTILPRLSGRAVQETGKRRMTDRDKVLSSLAADGSITRIEVEQLTGLSTASAARLLHFLVEEGVIEPVGNGKNRYYISSDRYR